MNKDVIKESKVSNTEEIFEDDDTLTYRDIDVWGSQI